MLLATATSNTGYIFSYENPIYPLGVIMILIHSGPPHLHACDTGSMVSIFYS
jgi:hypothetical protein